MPAASDILLDGARSMLDFSEPVLSKVPATQDPCPVETDHLDRIHPGMREIDLPEAVPNTKEMETSRLSCVPCVTVPTPEQANNTLCNQSAVGDSEQESAKQKLSITGPFYSDSMHPGDSKMDTEPSQTSGLGPPGSSPPPIVYSTPEFSNTRTMPSSDSPMRYPSIAVVIPPPSWEQGAIRTNTRASDRDTGNYEDGNAIFYDTQQPSEKRKKRRPSIRPLSDPPDASIPVSCHCSGAIHAECSRPVLAPALGVLEEWPK
ncbi:hypothetical protein EYZ11_011976 [Aspergillus tanneri]|uniref:Uncharacterized protein n=1 Tax=Aspergillus tanneri TaxID=1220188 RepID=A0A4S3J1Z7_9EURO|nr:uncharacterized protein ATNIH1004_009452 [Aspergillus tanneri]KAA8642700.1 hypothetical protein ATNIH1004_009452 [Aspergillus tanneri]THC88572.1 hypothetical protein EYZ11_011976 [Aspergillus tanneri]